MLRDPIALARRFARADEELCAIRRATGELSAAGRIALDRRYNGPMSGPEDDRPSAPRSSIDAIIDLYKKDVDRTLLRAALELTPDQRLRRLVELTRFADAIRVAGKKAFR